MNKKQLGFASYDFSNSGYVAVFQSFLFPIVLAAALETPDKTSPVLWGAILAISTAFAVVISPFLGRFADSAGKGRVFSVAVLIVGVLAAATPIFDSSVMVLAVLFVAFNTVFELSQSLYDSFLLDIENTNTELNNLSTFSWGFGYLGGAVFAVVYLVLAKLGLVEPAMLTVFAGMFLVLSIPACLTFLKLPRRGPEKPLRERGLIPKNPVPWKDLIVYWIIADAVAAVVYFTPLFLRQELGLTLATVGMLMLGGQLLAFPMTIIVGRLSNKIGKLRTVRIGLLVWIVCVVGLTIASTTLHVVFFVIGLSFVLGSTQAILRSHFAERVSPGASGEGLGFFAIAQKSASIIAPALIALIASLTGSIRPGFIALAALLLIAVLVAGRLPRDPVAITPQDIEND